MGKKECKKVIVNFPERMRQVRKSVKLPQSTVAYRAKIPVKRIMRYESGELSPGINEIITIAKAMDVPVDYLICGNSFLDGYKVAKYIVGDEINIVSESGGMLTILLPNESKVRMSQMEFIERFNMSQMKLRKEIAANIIDLLMSQNSNTENQALPAETIDEKEV